MDIKLRDVLFDEESLALQTFAKNINMEFRKIKINDVGRVARFLNDEEFIFLVKELLKSKKRPKGAAFYKAIDKLMNVFSLSFDILEKDSI